MGDSFRRTCFRDAGSPADAVDRAAGVSGSLDVGRMVKWRTMPNKTLIAVALVIGLSAQTFAAARDVADWRTWRGPANGSTEQGAYPEKFGPDQCLWRVELPGKGCSTPIAAGGMIYVTTPADG